jgi:hypothetical protein
MDDVDDYLGYITTRLYTGASIIGLPDLSFSHVQILKEITL